MFEITDHRRIIRIARSLPYTDRDLTHCFSAYQLNIFETPSDAYNVVLWQNGLADTKPPHHSIQNTSAYAWPCTQFHRDTYFCEQPR
jgi:hypothetical protein